MSKSSSPRNEEERDLVIERQESLVQDEFARNGVEKQLHIVAKLIPFTIHVASRGISLHSSPISATLFYDSDDSEATKPVEGLKTSPLEYTSHVSSEGTKANVEIKINVLSSQHEGAFFRVLLSLVDPEDSSIKTVISQPIKVISKRNQAKKIVDKKSQSTEEPNSPPTAGLVQKRSALDVIAETLLRLEQQQSDQGKLIEHLIQNSAHSSPFSPVLDLKTAFRAFTNCLSSLSDEDRPRKIRRLIRNGESSDVLVMNQFMRDFVQELGYESEPLSNLDSAFDSESDEFLLNSSKYSENGAFEEEEEMESEPRRKNPSRAKASKTSQ